MGGAPLPDRTKWSLARGSRHEASAAKRLALKLVEADAWSIRSWLRVLSPATIFVPLAARIGRG
jgi:hypothetical protein